MAWQCWLSLRGSQSPAPVQETNKLTTANISTDETLAQIEKLLSDKTFSHEGFDCHYSLPKK